MFTKGRGSEVIWGVADYWVSRVTWNSEEENYHILGKVTLTILYEATSQAKTPIC